MKQTTKEKPVEGLEKCITNIFRKKTTNNNDTVEEGNDAKTVKVMNNDYGSSLPSTGETEETPISSEIRGGSVSELGLSDIFNRGRQKLVEMKIPAVRERKQSRMLRSEDFFPKSTRRSN